MRNRALVVAALLATCAVGAMPAHATPTQTTATPIKHLVVIFQENVSFDHYFGTYPNATNGGGQPFTARSGTPTVNGLSSALLTANPNARATPSASDPPHALTCDQDHEYTAEQQADDHGAMDKFAEVHRGGELLAARPGASRAW